MAPNPTNRTPTTRTRPSVRTDANGRPRARSQANAQIRSGANAVARTSGTARTNPSAATRRQSQSETARRTSGGSTIAAKLPFVAGIALAAIAVVAILAFALGGRGQSPDAGESSAGSGDQLPASEDAAATQESFSVSFASTGDLIFWREVADYIDANGGASAMANIDDYLAQADVTISNLESPLSDDESEPVIDKDIYIIGRPSAIESVKNSGIDIVSLANNHIMDYTGPALSDTLDALDDAGVLHAGAGMTESQAETPVETTVNGASIAFFSWTDIIPNYYLAFGDEPGVVSARMNMDDACKRVREAKETHDIVIVAMHWGVEYEDYITDYLQQTPAHQLADAGADVVLGNHPHVMQGVEFYNGSFIAYAHGNCVFRQSHDFGHTHESILLNFDITDEGIGNVVATPLYLDDEYGIPDFATGAQAQETLGRLKEISSGMNVNVDIRDDKAYLTPAA